jgi:DNA-binding cell septation regulator SpoVG
MSTAEPNRKDPNMSIAYTSDTDQSRPSRKVEVLDIRPVNHGAVKAYARIKVGAFTISGCKVIQQAGQRPWVKLPDQQSKEGKWFPIVTCSSPTLEEAISEAVLDAYRMATVTGRMARGGGR